MDKKKILLVSLGHLSCDINGGALPAILPFLRAAYDLSYQATGGLMFAYACLSSMIQPLFGLLSDRFSKPWFIPVGVLLAGCGLAAIGWMSGYWGIFAAIGLSGIGAALAHRLLDKGAEVVLSARRQARLEEVAGTHPRALVLPHDVTDPASWRQCWAHMREQESLPDLIVFCAADYRPEQSWQLQHEHVRQTLDTNLAGVYFGLETILPDLMARQSGGIVLVASVAGYIGLPGACVYGPGKAALINLAELLHAELRQHHLGVYLVNPGFVSTRLTALNDFSMPAIISPDAAAADWIWAICGAEPAIVFSTRT